MQIRAFENIVNFHVMDKITSLEDSRSAIMKITSASLCSRACNGFCRNGYFLRKVHSSSDKCRDCERKVRKEKKNERRKAFRLKRKKVKKERILEINIIAA